MRLLIILLILNASLLVLGQQQPHVEIVATGMTWAENIIISQANGVAFVSDIYGGNLWKIYRNETSQQFEKRLFLGQDSCHNCPTAYFGLALVETTRNILYVVVKFPDGQSAVIQMDPDQPLAYEIVSIIPKLGNGLAYHQLTGLLYVTSEGFFMPEAGEIFEVDPIRKTSRILFDRLYATDGAWIDQEKHWLYVSEVVGSRVLVIDLLKGNIIRKFEAPCTMLDDFTLSRDGLTMIGADYWAGRIVEFSAWDGSNGTTLLDNVRNPTSVRFGPSLLIPNSNRQSLFVTEGGSLNPIFRKPDRNVLEIDIS